jgi:hypothetical protein
VLPVGGDEIGIFGELGREGFTAALIPALNTFLEEGADGGTVSRVRSISAFALLTGDGD